MKECRIDNTADVPYTNEFVDSDLEDLRQALRSRISKTFLNNAEPTLKVERHEPPHALPTTI